MDGNRYIESLADAEYRDFREGRVPRTQDKDEQLRELLSYCETERDNDSYSGFGSACGSIAEKLRAILDGEQ